MIRHDGKRFVAACDTCEEIVDVHAATLPDAAEMLVLSGWDFTVFPVTGGAADHCPACKRAQQCADGDHDWQDDPLQPSGRVFCARCGAELED